MRLQIAHSKPCALVQSLPPVPRTASSTGRRQSRHRPARHATGSDLYGITPRITHIDRVIIRAYLRENFSALTTNTMRAITPGQEAGVEWLPDCKLPSGVRTLSLPAALECKLSALPAGFERVTVDRDVLLIATATREIIDVMCNAYANGGAQHHAARGHHRPPAPLHFLDRARRDSAARWRLYERDSIL